MAYSSLHRLISYLALLLLSSTLSGCGITTYQQDGNIQPLTVKLGETQWDGVHIPNGQQCRKFGGDGHSPALTISNIPKGTEAIIVEFSDRSWFPMNHGGHGKIGIQIKPEQQQITFPAVAGETFEVPDEHMFIFHDHRGDRGKPGAYLPPCSGGRGNNYFADVKAVRHLDIDKQTAELLGEGSVFLGEY